MLLHRLGQYSKKFTFAENLEENMAFVANFILFPGVKKV